MAECQGPQRRGFDAKTTIPFSPELSNRWCRGWDNFGCAPGAVVGAAAEEPWALPATPSR